MAKIACIYILTNQNVYKSYINIYINTLLVYLQLVKHYCFVGNIYINNILLQETASIEEQRKGLLNIKIKLIKGLLLKLYLLTDPIIVL